MTKRREVSEPGEVSVPVEFREATWLFRIEERPAPSSADPEDARRVARQELGRQAGERSDLALIAGLRRSARLRLHLENLGFGYVPEAY